MAPVRPPYFCERVDYIYRHTHHWSGTDLGDRLPSEVFKEHVILCFIDDAVGIENRHHLNIDNITRECDYPHSDTTWPYAPEVLMKSLAGVPNDEINKITHLNAMGHFQYDPFTHIPRDRATVSSLRSLAIDWDISIKSVKHLLAGDGIVRERAF